MHPSTRVYYGKQILEILAHHPEYIFQGLSQKCIESQQTTGGSFSSQKVIKLPFTSGSESLTFSNELDTLVDTLFYFSSVTYGWIVQSKNKCPFTTLLGTPPFEVRCMVTNDKLICGISKFNRIDIDIVRIFTIDDDGNLELSLSFINLIDSHKDDSNLYNYLLDCRNIVLHHEKQIIELSVKAFRLFNQLIVKDNLPSSIEFSSWTDHDQQFMKNSKQQSTMFLQQFKNLTTLTNPGYLHSSNYYHILEMLSHQENYKERTFYEDFLRIDLMYWYEEKRFYVNEVETWACGKLSSPYNQGIYALLLKNLL
jgi:hypothetical protein